MGIVEGLLGECHAQAEEDAAFDLGLSEARVKDVAGIEDADSVVVSTDGDNTNLVIGQVAQKRFGIECTVVRILDPARAEFYNKRGLRTICPTSTAIDALSDAVRTCVVPPREEATV